MSVQSELRKTIKCILDLNDAEIKWAKSDPEALPYVRDATVARRMNVSEKLNSLIINDRMNPCSAISDVMKIAHTFKVKKCITSVVFQAHIDCERVRKVLE
jgi:hypothetical protein